MIGGLGAAEAARLAAPRPCGGSVQKDDAMRLVAALLGLDNGDVNVIGRLVRHLPVEKQAHFMERCSALAGDVAGKMSGAQ